MRKAGRFIWPMLLMACAIASAAPLPPPGGPSDEAEIREALHWLGATPQFDSEYDFEMTVQIRFLLFWAGKDDVGGGYIKAGEATDDLTLRIIQLLFGSDPAKAHGINRWGGGTEVVKLGKSGATGSSAFMGFMKSSKGDSVGSMQQELSKEKTGGQHRFEAIISRVDAGRAVSTTVPFSSEHDFDFHDLEPAEKVVMDRLKEGQERQFHAVETPALGCDRGRGFLSTVLELNDRALQRPHGPDSLCYVYNSNQYTLSLVSTRAIAEKVVHYTLRGTNQSFNQKYHKLIEARYQITNPAGKKTDFNILLGSDGALRGAPVQINYQPNWWFQIALNLKPPNHQTAASQ